MNIKEMLADVFAGGKFDGDALIDLIKAVVGKILVFVAKEEGYDYPTTK